MEVTGNINLKFWKSFPIDAIVVQVPEGPCFAILSQDDTLLVSTSTPTHLASSASVVPLKHPTPSPPDRLGQRILFQATRHFCIV